MIKAYTHEGIPWVVTPLLANYSYREVRQGLTWIKISDFAANGGFSEKFRIVLFYISYGESNIGGVTFSRTFTFKKLQVNFRRTKKIIHDSETLFKEK